jgi:hypothetical protein
MSDVMPTGPADEGSFKPLGQISTPAASPTTQTQGLPTGPADAGTFRPLGANTSTGTPPEKPAPQKGDIDYSTWASTNKGALDNLAQDTIDAGKGAAKGIYDTIAKPPQDDGEKAAHGIGGPAGLAIYRTLAGLGHGAAQLKDVPGMIRDINNGPDPLGAYAKAAQRTSSQGAGQALTAVGTEGVIKAPAEISPSVQAAYKAVGNKFSPKYLQEPLQNDLHGVLEQTAKDSNIGGPPPEMNYVHDETGKLGNTQHQVTTTDASGKKVGELAAQNTAPDTVTVRSNQVYDTANRGRGYGQSQIQKLLGETKASGKKFVQSDISTTPDAQRAWRKLEQDHPDAITSKEFKPKAVEGQPEPLGSKTQWTVDLDKYQPPAAEPLKATSTARPASIRDAAGDMGDKVFAESKADYQALDEATNGRFQRFRDKLEANRKKLNNLTDSDEDRQTEASILKNQKETEDAMNDAFEEAKAKGVDPKLIDRADANFKKSQALYDLDTAVKRSTTGARPGVSHPDLVAEHPETLNPKSFHKRINTMYDSGRLQDALGEEQANKLFDSTLDHSGAHDKIMRNRKIGMAGMRYGGGAVGLGAAGHYAAPVLMGGH